MKTYMEKTKDLFCKMSNDPNKKLLHRNAVIELNLRLVAHILKKYRPYTDDQYQAGCIGLIVAVDTFKEDVGVPFSSYACFCIEREIHKMHRKQAKFIENILADKLVYLNETIQLKNGDEVSLNEAIPDILAQEQFDKVLEENDLTSLFKQVIIPCVDAVAGNNRGVTPKADRVQWSDLELRYILEFAEIQSQKLRFNYSKMSELLGMSVTRIRSKHLEVMELIRKRCKELGYNINEM